MHGHSTLLITQSPKSLPKSARMLLYLTDRTWQPGAQSKSLASEISSAMERGIPLLLAHEMPGVHASQRHACEFSVFFDSTPRELIARGVYNQIAIALKGAQWRSASMAILMGALAGGRVEGRQQSRRLQLPKRPASQLPLFPGLRADAAEAMPLTPQGQAGSNWQPNASNTKLHSNRI